MMRFEWDEAKNRTNIRKHGFDFAEAEEMFRGVLLVAWDWHGSGAGSLCRVHSALARCHSRHLAEKGRS